MADRFYFEGPLSKGPATLDGPEAHHLGHVRRLQVGDRMVLFNGDGKEYLGTIAEIAKKRAEIVIDDVTEPSRELGFGLHLAVAMPKGDRGDFLIEKATELGVTDFTPLMTERGIVKVDADKLEKMRRAVIEASKQCGRNVLMRIHQPVKFLDWCSQVSGQRWIAHLSDSIASQPIVVIQKAGAMYTFAIGPEGGFTDAEANAAIAAGWHLANLGNRILRIETAAIAIAATFNALA
jgi:16S rRNA (uracil1498-N3)-methyltransferase